MALASQLHLQSQSESQFYVLTLPTQDENLAGVRLFVVCVFDDAYHILGMLMGTICQGHYFAFQEIARPRRVNSQAA